MSMFRRSSSGNSAYQDVAYIYNHIVDPNERRRLVLAEIDKSPFGWYHIRAIVVAGVGFFTDAYDVRLLISLTFCGSGTSVKLWI
jgi:MFS transporter, PHS family, inorganic phosphate transporter